MDNTRFEWKMQGLNRNARLNKNPKFEWIMQGLNGKYKVCMENTRFEWIMQGLK